MKKIDVVSELQSLFSATVFATQYNENFTTALLDLIRYVTTATSAVAGGLILLSWIMGTLLAGAPIPFREFKETGYIFKRIAVKEAMWLAVGGGVIGLPLWIAKALGIY